MDCWERRSSNKWRLAAQDGRPRPAYACARSVCRILLDSGIVPVHAATGAQGASNCQSEASDPRQRVSASGCGSEGSAVAGPVGIRRGQLWDF